MEKVTMQFDVLDTEEEELKIMYFLSQVMGLMTLDDEEKHRVVTWFNDKYQDEGIK